MDYFKYIGNCERCPHIEERDDFWWCPIHSLEVYNKKNAGCKYGDTASTLELTVSAA